MGTTEPRCTLDQRTPSQPLLPARWGLTWLLAGPANLFCPAGVVGCTIASVLGLLYYIYLGLQGPNKGLEMSVSLSVAVGS